MWLNTGNYIVARTFYLTSFDPEYTYTTHDNLRCMEAKIRSWFLLKAGATLRLIPSMEYIHAVHDGSLYITTPEHLRSITATIVNELYQSL